MQDEIKIAFIIGFACLAMFTFVLAIVVFVLIHQRRMLEKEKKIKQIEEEKQIEIFNASAQAEEKEKERIARNLHDEINPMLIILKQNLQRHRFNIIKNKFDPNSLETDYALIDKLSDGIRACSYDLVPTFLMKYGLIRSLGDYVRSLNGVNAVQTQFRVEPSANLEFTIPWHDQLNIYRMCLEVVTNILKHTSCNYLSLSISKPSDVLHIAIAHNGKGVNNLQIEAFSEKEGGLGLKSIKARAFLLKAAIDYNTNLLEATVNLSIPLKK